MMVNSMMTAMVLTMGPMEFSEKQESVSESVATTDKARKATAKPAANLVHDAGRKMVAMAAQLGHRKYRAFRRQLRHDQILGNPDADRRSHHP